MAKVAKTTQKKAPAKTKKPEAAVPAKTTKATGLVAQVLGVDGKAAGTMTLPEELFGQKVNRDLIAQAVRIYLANQRAGGASTKTRGKVEGSTRKIFKQKGTGRARHGSIRAPIFVGGGISFGPVPHDFAMAFPVTMKRKALASVLSSQHAAGNVVVMDDLTTVKAKTKNMAETLAHVGQYSSMLLVLAKDSGSVSRSARNIKNVDVVPYANLNTYEVMTHQKVVFMKQAVSEMKETFVKEKNS